MDNQSLTATIPQHSSRHVWFYGLTITLCSFYFGYNIAVFNSCQDNVAAALSWGGDKEWYIGFFTAAFPFGAMLSSTVTGTVANSLGRRRTCLLCACGGIGASLLNIIPNTYTFGAARLLAGAVCGFMTALPPIFLNEVCPVHLFGRMGTLIQFEITFGIVVAEALALPLPTGHFTEHSLNNLWVMVFGFPAAVMLLQILLFVWVVPYESPAWLLRNGRRGDALKSYAYIYSEIDAEQVLDAVEAASKTSRVEMHGKESTNVEDTTDYFTIKSYLTTKKYRHMLSVGVMLQILQQWSGVNAIFSYSSSMYDLGVFEARIFSLSIGVVNMFALMCALPFVDRSGRRPLLLLGNAGCALALIAAGFSSLYSINEISMVASLSFVVFFEMGLGPLVWVYCGEVLYDEAMSVSVMVNWLGYFLVVLTFPQIESVGIWYSFWLYAGILILGEVFLYFFLLETKGKSKKELQKKFLDDGSES